MDNILESIKKLLGLPNEYEYFDNDILIHINTAFSMLNQLNVGDPNGFEVSENSKWNEFIKDDNKTLSMAKNYVYLKVRLLFDPPANQVLVTNIKDNISEIEFRILSNTDY